VLGLEFIRDLAVVMVIAGVVGWLCQRIGLSLVVGYLVAGAIIGPFTPPFQLVADLDRVQMLSQLGLVFLIFSIGLNLGLPRLRRLGLSVVLATVIGAILVLNGCRVLGLALGWSSTESLFVAGMLMVSSSAIISKVLQELNAVHQRHGQLALGVTVLEDVVAVVMLTLLSTLVQFGDKQSPQLAQTIGALGAFVVALLLVALLFVPRLLRKLTRTGSPEVRTLLVIGLLLSLAWLAARAGYSLALGAFLLGVIVASTPQKPEIERVFEGIRDMFGAVFFVAMGMLVDFRLLAGAWPLVLILTAFALVCRPLATAMGLSLAGHSTRDSVRAGLALTPLGEFSFIIAQMGVAAGAVPQSFYPTAVGVSLLTTLLAPSLMRRSDAISARVDGVLPLFAREWISFYHSWLKRLGRHQQRSALWRLSGVRLAQTAVQVLFVSALVLFAKPLYERLDAKLGTDWLFPNGLTILFWSGFGIVLLAPLVAIWRNIEALAMIFAESATTGNPRRRSLRLLLETALKSVASALLVVWLLALLPFGVSIVWVSAVVLGILGLLALIFWRRLVRWHSRLEIELQTQLKAALGSTATANLAQALQERQEDWQLQAEEFVVPDFATCTGRNIGALALRKRFGCSIASIDRQGFIISNPSAEVVLYPQDKLLLLGTTGQIEEAARELGGARTDRITQDIEELGLEIVGVPTDSPKAGETLAELDPIRKVGVQVAGIQRGGRHTLTPSGTDNIAAGDELLVLGTPRQIQEFREWLNPLPAADAPSDDRSASA
jgi:CPA2 family monovalent cation:H+ antiporter-2